MSRRADRVARLEAALPPVPAAGRAARARQRVATFGECSAAQDVLLRHGHDIAAAMLDPTMMLLFTAARARLAGQTVPDLLPGAEGFPACRR